jgi:hypothetical protein
VLRRADRPADASHPIRGLARRSDSSRASTTATIATLPE